MPAKRFPPFIAVSEEGALKRLIRDLVNFIISSYGHNQPERCFMEAGSAAAPKPRMILLGRMYKKVSQKTGEEYFRGTLGYPQTFLFKDKNSQEDNVWCLYAQEREPNYASSEARGNQTIAPHPRPLTQQDPW
jgi:hypothetical protein